VAGAVKDDAGIVVAQTEVKPKIRETVQKALNLVRKHLPEMSIILDQLAIQLPEFNRPKTAIGVTRAAHVREVAVEEF
jgi:hypothetical protein